MAKAYGGKRKIHWMEIYAGEKSTKVYGPDVWLPDETLDVLKEFVVSIKGPLTTPVGGGIRSLNVALRQQLDLYVCLRPVRYFKGVPSPLKEPEKTDMVIVITSYSIHYTKLYDQTFAELAFSFTLTPSIVASSLAFALAMGFVGGFLPAARAARMKIVDALRAA